MVDPWFFSSDHRPLMKRNSSMDDLTYTLRQLCQRNRDGSFATQADRQRSLALMARQLREAGFCQMRAPSLKGKHVDVLLQRWKAEGLTNSSASSISIPFSSDSWIPVSTSRLACLVMASARSCPSPTMSST
jgi:hypothetical protein